MSSDGHGIPDNAAKGAHDLLHHAEQEQHQHDAEAKRGLPDGALEAEKEFTQGVERRASQPEGAISKIKETLGKMMPGNN